MIDTACKFCRKPTGLGTVHMTCGLVPETKDPDPRNSLGRFEDLDYVVRMMLSDYMSKLKRRDKTLLEDLVLLDEFNRRHKSLPESARVVLARLNGVFREIAPVGK